MFFPECSFSPEKSRTEFDGIKSSMGFKFGDATFHQMEQLLASLFNSSMGVYSAHKVGVDFFECRTRRLCLKDINAYLSECIRR